LELEEIKGVGPAVAKRLKTAGFVNAESIAVTPIKEFMQRAGYKELGPARCFQVAGPSGDIGFSGSTHLTAFGSS